jgi:hypothetical protein
VQFCLLLFAELVMGLLHLPGTVIGPLVLLGHCYLLVAVKISTGKLAGYYLPALATYFEQQLLACCP